MTTLDYALLSKTVSFALRHRPQDLGLTLDKEGWCSTKIFYGKKAEKVVRP